MKDLSDRIDNLLANIEADIASRTAALAYWERLLSESRQANRKAQEQRNGPQATPQCATDGCRHVGAGTGGDGQPACRYCLDDEALAREDPQLFVKTKRSPVVQHLNRAIVLGQKAEPLGDEWQKAGHEPGCNGSGSGWCDCPPAPEEA